MSVSRRKINYSLWAASFVCFVAGTLVGMLVHATIGAFLWFVSVLLALAPFANHRNKHV